VFDAGKCSKVLLGALLPCTSADANKRQLHEEAGCSCADDGCPAIVVSKAACGLASVVMKAHALEVGSVGSIQNPSCMHIC